jgi:hypothetical protein
MDSDPTRIKLSLILAGITAPVAIKDFRPAILTVVAWIPELEFGHCAFLRMVVN